MNNTSRCREKIEGRISRRRTYRCRTCNSHFQVDSLHALDEANRICPDCRGYVYTFTDKRTGEEQEIRASNIELATLRAWRINPNLTFKV